MVKAINGLSLNPPPHSNLTEGILDIGKTSRSSIRSVPSSWSSPSRRPVGRRVVERGAQSAPPERRHDVGGDDRHEVRPAGPSASLADESNREQVIGDGAKQSGGRRVEVAATISVSEGAAADRR